MLMGILIYGGSISGILIRTRGTPAAAATLIDGYPLALKGGAGKAIGIATFVGGVIGALIMAFLAPEIAQFGLRFGPAEFFALVVFGLTMIISISGESLLKGAIAALFGFAQVFRNIEKMKITPRVKSKVGKILPSFKEIKRLFPTVLKSGGMGTFTGSVPGLGADVAAFVAYGEAKRTSKHPEEFGKGALEGVATPEAANNGATGGAITAVLLGALTIHGFQPGPLMFRDNLDIVYPIFAGMILCQFVLLFVGLSGARLFAKLINIDNKVLTPIIFLLCIADSTR